MRRRGIGVKGAVGVLTIMHGDFALLALIGELHGNRKRGQYSPLGVKLRQVVESAVVFSKGHVHYQSRLLLSCCLFWDFLQVPALGLFLQSFLDAVKVSI